MSNVSISPLLVLLLIWSMIWKGIGMWRAAQNNQKYWFVALLPINTAGLLEIIYLTKFAKKPLTMTEFRSWFSRSPKKSK